MRTMIARASHPPYTPDASRGRAWLALMSRTVLFAGWQSMIALIYAVSGNAAPWVAAAAWWPLTAAGANLMSIALLSRWLKQEGARFWDLFRLERFTWRRDLLVVLGLLVVSAPLGILPSYFLATSLYGDPLAPVELFFRPLPLWAAWLGVAIFPTTIALAELSTYFGFAMPRLGRGWGAVLAAACFLGLQHVTLPLLFDWRFVVWRGAMYLPFAVLLALALRWRPRLLPYLAVVHGLLDLQAAWMVLAHTY